MDYFRDFVANAPPIPDPYHRASKQLNAGDIVFSATRAFRLIMQTDGNLVWYVIEDASLPEDITKGQYKGALWESGTEGSGAVRCDMQADGNLVLYRGDGAPVWALNTQGHPGAFLRCQDDGNLVLYFRGDALWASGTNVQQHGPTMGAAIAPPAPPGPKIWIDYGAAGWGKDGGTDGVVYGSGFANPQCTVAVSGSGLINPPIAHGNILNGIAVQTPCVNMGQTITVKATSNSGETVVIQPLCPQGP